MIFRKSITAKFILAVFVILIVGQSVGAVISIIHTRSTHARALQSKIQRIGNIAAGVSTYPLLSYDYSTIDMYIEEITRDEEIVAMQIRDNKGKVIREKIKADANNFKTVNPFHFKEIMSFKMPVTAGGSKIGEVVISYTPKNINDHLTRSIVLIVLYQSIVIISVGILLMFLFNRNIKTPVTAINRVIEKITVGDLSTEVPDLGENEIGSIARGVAFLKENLSLTLMKLHSTATNVSMAIKQLDHTYKNALDNFNKQSNAVREIMKSIHYSTKSQLEISDSTEKLMTFSEENVTSVLEMKATAEEIASNTQRLFKATEEAYSVALQLSQTAKSISSNANDVSSAVDDTSASVEEVSASIREVEEHAGESAMLASTVKEIASDTGMLAVVNAMEGMDKISEEVRKSSDIIQRLGARSVDIEKVLSVIKDVTEQTNLLSLNAAILAAQAGEYGKSFSVVADEIRALSERTASSTREIGVIVKTIQKDIKDAVKAVDSAQMKVEEGNNLVVKVGEALKETLTAAEHSTEMTRAIERATEEQSLGLRQIMSAIEDIRRKLNSVVKSTKEQEGALSYLLDSIGEVKEVAEISKRGTGEQAEGTKVITRNIELANERIGQINKEIINQRKLSNEVVAAMEQINSIGSVTIKDMEEVSASLKTLSHEIETLRNDMEAFKVK